MVGAFVVWVGILAQAVAPPVRVVSLAEAERVALGNQPALSQARSQTRAAYARVDVARAPLLPQVSANASYTRRTANFVTNPGSLPQGVTARPSTATFDTYNGYNAGLTASQLIYDFGQTTGSYHTAQATAEAAHESEEGVRQSVLLGVRSAYLQAWAGRALIVVARDNLANQDRHLKQVQAAVQIGTRPEIDLAQVRADRANAELLLINDENAYETAKAQLNQAMGVEQSTDYDVAEERIPDVSGEQLDDEQLTRLAVAARPEIRTIDKQLESAERQIRSIKGAYGPSLGVSTGLTESGADLSALTWNWNAIASLNWPIFQGGVTDARVREAEANQSATRSQKSLTRQQIRFDVVQARLAVRAGKAALLASKEVEVNARERLRLAEARYQAGAGAIIELQDAQVAATTAAGQVVQADYGLSLARAQLLRALGKP
jgi:outer membrane protein